MIGAWKAYPLAVWVTGIGMVLVAAFTLRALVRTFFSEKYSRARLPEQNEPSAINGRITLPEKIGAGLLIFATLAIGIYPKLLLDRIVPAVEAMRILK